MITPPLVSGELAKTQQITFDAAEARASSKQLPNIAKDIEDASPVSVKSPASEKATEVPDGCKTKATVPYYISECLT